MDIDQQAMVVHRKSQSRNIAEHAPIAKVLSTLDSAEAKIKKKFYIAYMICKQQRVHKDVYVL